MSYISADLRRLVIERAANCCEYCRVSQLDRFFSYEVDHIIAEKHGGQTTAQNLCFSCFLCNGYKGRDIAPVDWEISDEIVPLFNPRKHRWSEHFRLDGARIEPLTPQGRVTAILLRFNDPKHLAERQVLLESGRYPCN